MPRVQTRIIATLGPASARAAVLRRMLAAGLDLVRLNFSHGSHRDHAALVRLVRQLNARRGRRLRILQDLEGPRIRVGKLPGGQPVELKPRQLCWLYRGARPAGGAALPLDYPGPLAPVRAVKQIFIDDGNIVLAVKGVAADRIKTEVVIGGRVKEHKGINLPGAALAFPLLSAKDRRDLEFGIAATVDYIAQSFVRGREDIVAVARVVKPRLPDVKLIAKIETREGVENLDGILAVADGIMVARGDLGVAVPIWEVPALQKELIRRAKARGKLAITATQMLESMTENRRPTRAEATDVANAVLDGTDFVMLSGETAVGKYPAEAVDTMNRICRYTEEHLLGRAPLP